MNLARNPLYSTFFTLNFIAENNSLLLVVQLNQLIEHVSSHSGGLGTFTRTKNTRLPGVQTR